MMAWLDDVKVRCTRLSLRLQVAGQMKLVSGTLKTWKVVYVLVIINFPFVSSYMYLYVYIYAVTLCRHHKVSKGGLRYGN